ncbi:hypothetical protein H7F15_01190 [Pontibacter sp. Tf4]|uniref:hypothetical protein n=1 Tax=Pontibacter sp. Tf4 TaxID=2761620 RepID=UPI001625E173|nr:hypothetical protein [Pontibacter sp. Tf4]MBB6609641.1 hypothetical protein [Pontibacter sp. Tf4]
MRNYSIACIAIALVALVACEQPVPRNSSADGTFDVAGYVQQEIQRLQTRQPAVLKSVRTENEPAETIQLERVEWAEELAVFEEADINKPTLKEYYSREEQVLPEGGKAITFNRLPDAEAPIERLYLHLSPENKLQRLEATLQDQNLLFYSRRKAVLEADPLSGHLQSYHINGVQKLVFSDSLHYSVQVNL